MRRGGVRLLRFSGKQTFHPKVYLFETYDGYELLLGSANLSRSAFFLNIEAVMRLIFARRSDVAADVLALLKGLKRRSVPWTAKSIDRYEKNWHQARPIQARGDKTVSAYLRDREIYKPLPANLSYKRKVFVFTGRFGTGTQIECMEDTTAAGGQVTNNRMTHETDILVVGAKGSPSYFMKKYGRKIQQACDYRKKTGKPLILTEAQWSNRLH